MATTVFVAPGVYTQEQNFSVFAATLGTTYLGLVGVTPKGPAFLPTQITSLSNYQTVFGGTNPMFPLSYVAQFYLNQSNQLTVTRVLGNEGYTNSPAWLIVADNTITYSGTITVTGMTLSESYNSNSNSYTFVTSAATVAMNYSNNTILSTSVVGNTYNLAYSGNSVSTQAWVNALNATSFSGLGISVVGASLTTYISSGTSQSFTLTTTQDAKGAYSGATLAVIRSQRNPITGQFYFNNPSDIQIGINPGNALTPFFLSSGTGLLSGYTNSGFTVSLDETSQAYIVNSLTQNPQVEANYPFLYVEEIYPHFVREATKDGTIIRVRPQLVYTNEASYSNYQDGYQGAVTPMIVSRVIGGQVNNLFYFTTIPDGNAANSEIKISIQNIDPINLTFDVMIRNYNDTDATASQNAFEYYSNCSMNPLLSNFIGTQIGTTDGTYPSKSDFVTLNLAAIIPPNSVPAGFQGYNLRSSGVSGTTAPQIYYKTSYLSSDTIFQTYMGLSELAYTGLTVAGAGFANAVKSLETDLWDFPGAITTSGLTTTKGFHLENIAPASQYVTGPYATLSSYTTANCTLIDKTQIKFTVTPYGGFDGWDELAVIVNPSDQFTAAYTNNILAFQQGIATMSDPALTTMNLFATPGIDFENNFTVINYAIQTITLRADSLYIIDAPRLTAGSAKGNPNQLVQIAQSTGINSNYVATYWPWIQIQDQTSGTYLWTAPTCMVVAAIAFTDKVAQPWFAPAGYNRGVGGPQVIQPDIKLIASQKVALGQGNINPIIWSSQGFGGNGGQGAGQTVIFAQNTLTNVQSALQKINVRRLLLQTEKLISTAALTLVFEQNDQTLIDTFLAKVEPIMNQIQNQQGFAQWSINMDSSDIDGNVLNGVINVQPVLSAEIINLTFAVYPGQGASFAAL